MNRNEFLEAYPITRLSLRLTGGTLEICTDAIDDVHVMVSGADKDVEALRIEVKGDQLVVEQPAASLARNPVGSSWLQVTIRLPQSWKGRIDARTVTGWISARCLVGTDFTLESVSGLITANMLQFRTVVIRTVTGDIRLHDMVCEDKCTLGSTSGTISVQTSCLAACSLNTITGGATLSLLAPFREISAASVIGDLAIDAPIAACTAAVRSVSGKTTTSGVSILEDAEAAVHFTSVSGNLDISSTDEESVYEAPAGEEPAYEEPMLPTTTETYKEDFNNGTTEFRWFRRRRQHAAADASGAEDAAADDRGPGEA